MNDSTLTIDIEVRLVEPGRVSQWVTRWRDFESPAAATEFMARLNDGSLHRGKFAAGQPWQKRLVQVSRTVLSADMLTVTELADTDLVA